MKLKPPLNWSLPLLLWVSGSIAISVAALWVARHFVPAEWFRANNEVAGNYLQTLGTIYAVLLAFVVFVVWQQHNEARDAVEREANELADLHRVLYSFGSSGSHGLHALTREYQAAVVGDEWTSLARGHATARAERTLED